MASQKGIFYSKKFKFNQKRQLVMSICNCSTALPALSATKCGENFDGVNLMAFVKLSAVSSTPLSTLLASTTSIATKTNWTASGVVGTAVAVTPMVYNLTPTPGDARTWDDGRGGMVYMGTDDTEITAELRMAKVAQVALMKDLMCIAQNGDLGVVFFTESGGVVAKSGYLPIPVKYMFVGDRAAFRHDEPDSNNIVMRFEAGWSDDIAETALSYTDGTSTITWVGTDLLA